MYLSWRRAWRRRWPAGAGAACAVAVATAAATTAAAQTPPATIEAQMAVYVDEALQSNDALRAQTLAWQQSLQALDAARRRYYPTLGVSARYTLATGGRTVEIPVGDLLNPVYRTLNELTRAQGMPADFPQVDNQSIDFLRSREQDTRLTLTAPLYAPQLDAQVRSQLALADVEAARREALARTLVRDVEQAWCNAARAQTTVVILQASEAALAANTHANRALFDAGKVTRDRILRAEAEQLAVQQQLAAARNAGAQARRYLNFLANRAEDAPLNIDAAQAERAAAVATGSTLQPPAQESPPAGQLADRLDATRDAQPRNGAAAAAAAAAATSPSPPSGIQLRSDERMLPSPTPPATGAGAPPRAGTGASGAAETVAERPELRQLDSAIAAARAGERGQRAAYLPQLSLAADYGYQGDHYRFAADSDVGTASLIASWTLFDFGERRAREQAAALDAERLEAQRRSLQRQLQLARSAAEDDLATQRDSLITARARLAAAAEAFRIAERKRDAGSLSEVEFLDAERARTEARLGLAATYYAWLAARAQLEYQAASYPLPDALRLVPLTEAAANHGR
jgi:outer membrane protein TolC